MAIPKNALGLALLAAHDHSNANDKDSQIKISQESEDVRPDQSNYLEMVDPMLKFYGTFLYFWRLCFSYDLESNYITKQDILDAAETTNLLSKNAVAADGKKFQDSIADKKYY
jgi:hypothetical protein